MIEADRSLRREDQPQTPAEACLRPVLGALGWTGDLRQLHEVLPSGGRLPDFEALCDVLDRLNFTAIRLNPASAAIGADATPALIARPDGDIWVVIRAEGAGQMEVFKGRASRIETVPLSRIEGDYYFIRPADAEAEPREQGRFGWISALLDQERPSIAMLFGITLLVNLLSLSLPLYLMAVFDMAIGSLSTQTLITLGIGMGIVILTELALRETRARALAGLAVRTQATVMSAVFDKLLRLPIGYVESAPLTAQLNRLKMFESVREIFSGPLAVALLDMPFVIIFIIAVFAISGSLGWVMVGFMVAISVLVAISVPRARASALLAGRRRAETRLFRQDTAMHHLTIRETGAVDVWLKRYRDLIARHLSATQAAQKISFNEQTLAQALTVLAGALIVGLGGAQVLSGELTAGALVALMAIVWRILSPIQTAFLSLNRLFQALDTAAQINALMNLPQESRGGSVRRFFRRIRGDITLENAGFRYPAQSTPALRGIDLAIAAGEFVVITGPKASGRSTLMKLLATLYAPSFGRMLIDGSPTSQFDIRELRSAIALVNSEQTIFSDTLAQNLAFANPTASREQMEKAVRDADLTAFVEQLSDGLNTDLTDLLAHGLSGGVEQKIRLARAYLAAPRIYLFDDPLNDLDESGRIALIARLASLKGEATIIVTEPDAEILKLADRAIGLKAGQLVPPIIAGKLAQVRRVPHADTGAGLPSLSAATNE